MHDEAPRPLRALVFALLSLDLVLLVMALRLGSGEVRDGAGSVTTGENVALAIVATLGAALALQAIRLPRRLRAFAQAFALGAQAAHALGHLARWYYLWRWYDDVLHLVIVLVASLLALRIAQATNVFPGRHATRTRAALVVVTLAVALAGAWEIFEFTMDTLQGTREQDDLADTMLDMIDGAIGGALAAGYAAWRPRPARSRS